MTTRSPRSWTTLALGLALGAAGCISGEGEPATGDAQVFPGAPVPITDYDPSLAPMAGAAAPQAGQPAAPAAPTGSAAGAQAPADPAGAGAAPAGTDTAPTDSAAPGTDPMAPGGGDDPATDPATTPTDPVDPTQAEPPPETAGPGVLTVDFTSTAVGGRYAPRNVGAVWIETSSGTFVKTLERWAGIRAGDLRTWNVASGGWGLSFFGFGGTSPDQVDAVTAATLRTHQAHHVMWDMIDNNEAVVPDGAYRLAVEVADGSARTAYFDFDKGPSPVELSVASESPVSNLTLTYQP